MNKIDHNFIQIAINQIKFDVVKEKKDYNFKL